MKIAYIAKKKEFVEELGREIVTVKPKKYFIKDTNVDFHTQYGIIAKKDLKKLGKVKTSNGKEISLIDATFGDYYSRIKRMAQIIPRKDIGLIIAETGIGKNSVVIDSGTGSGGVAILLSNIVKKVYSYDIRKDHQELTQKNLETLKIKNVALKIMDITKKSPVKNADLAVLDLPEPWLAIPLVLKSLKLGGWIVSYSPSITQTMDCVNKVECLHVKTIEIIQREWEVDGRKVRPKTQGIGHSGFLSFFRKI